MELAVPGFVLDARKYFFQERTASGRLTFQAQGGLRAARRLQGIPESERSGIRELTLE